LKKILIIQTDSTYFLEETLRTLESHRNYFENSEINLLVDKLAFREISGHYQPLLKNIYTEEESISSMNFDISFNLSCNEESWEIHRNINAEYKIGPQKTRNNNLYIDESWSTFYLTQNHSKSCLFFHLRDTYRNIIGIKNCVKTESKKDRKTKKIILGRKSITNKEDRFTLELKKFLFHQFQEVEFKGIDEVDFIENHVDSIYIGHPCLEALRLNDLGAKSILISTQFEGMNLVPYDEKNFLIIPKTYSIKFHSLCEIILNILNDKPKSHYKEFSVYETTFENNFGLQLKSLSNPDIKFMHYQINLVLWNYVLNLFELNLSIHEFSKEEIQHIRDVKNLVDKIQRIIEVAIKCCENIFHESKNDYIEFSNIQNYINQIKDTEECLEDAAKSNFSISQILDFYKLKRSFETEPQLNHQAQSTLINFIEEKHVLSAYVELVNLIINKNEQTSKM